jgi:CHAD domain-containing protein
MDAILREFRSSLPAPFRRLRPTLKRIMRALGDARDLDVALGELDTFCGSAPAADRQSVEPLKQHLAAERRRARTRMLRILDSAAVQEKLQRLTALLATPAGSPLRNSPEPALDVAPDLIRRRYRKLRKGADPLTADSPVEDFHAVRGHVKKLRYLLEAVAGLYGKPAAQMLRALCRWQEKLGVQQDAAVANRRLQALAGAPPKGLPPETLFVMGRFAEHYASVAGRARKLHAKGSRRIRERWKKLRTKLAESAVGDPAPAHGLGP